MLFLRNNIGECCGLSVCGSGLGVRFGVWLGLRRVGSGFGVRLLIVLRENERCRGEANQDHQSCCSETDFHGLNSPDLCNSRSVIRDLGFWRSATAVRADFVGAGPAASMIIRRAKADLSRETTLVIGRGKWP